MFTESLTVRILGDSSGLQQELGAVVSQLEGLQSLLAATGSGGRDLADGLRSAGDAAAPLRQVSSQLGSVQQQVRQLSSSSISLNVQPALSSLARLSASIQAVTAQLAQLSATSAAASAGASGGRPTRMPAGFAAGESFSREAPTLVGTTFLTALHSGGSESPASSRPAIVEQAVASTTNNHFGGITVQVTEAGGVNEIIRDLRLQGAALRVRRG